MLHAAEHTHPTTNRAPRCLTSQETQACKPRHWKSSDDIVRHFLRHCCRLGFVLLPLCYYILSDLSEWARLRACRPLRDTTCYYGPLRTLLDRIHSDPGCRSITVWPAGIKNLSLTLSALAFQMDTSICETGPVYSQPLGIFLSITCNTCIWQTVQTLIRGPFQEPSDLGLHYLQRTPKHVSLANHLHVLQTMQGYHSILFRVNFLHVLWIYDPSDTPYHLFLSAWFCHVFCM